MSESLTAFHNQQELVDQLIAIHGKLQSGRGRRHEQDAIHRAGVVLSVAAWQAYIEKVLLEALETISGDLREPGDAAPNWALHNFNLRRAQIKTLIKKFNTPDDVRVRDLLRDAIGFNPWPSWEWRQGRRQWDAKEVRQRTNHWVKIRHSVAHGFALPADIDWLQDANGRPRLTLWLLNECEKHFAHLAEKTDQALSAYLASEYGLEEPW